MCATMGGLITNSSCWSRSIKGWARWESCSSCGCKLSVGTILRSGGGAPLGIDVIQLILHLRLSALIDKEYHEAWFRTILTRFLGKSIQKAADYGGAGAGRKRNGRTVGGHSAHTLFCA